MANTTKPDQAEAHAPAPKEQAAINDAAPPPLTVSEDQFNEEYVEPDQGSSSRPYETTGATVIVASKLPNGIVMQLCRMDDIYEQVLGGGSRKTQIATRVGKRYTLNGCAQRHGENAQPVLTFGGYALTYGIPEDFWKEWVKQNSDSVIVQERLVYALPKANDVKKLGKERVGIRSGLEPVDPSKPMKVGLFEIKEAERV